MLQKVLQHLPHCSLFSPSPQRHNTTETRVSPFSNCANRAVELPSESLAPREAYTVAAQAFPPGGYWGKGACLWL